MGMAGGGLVAAACTIAANVQFRSAISDARSSKMLFLSAKNQGCMTRLPLSLQGNRALRSNLPQI